jgi:hypothetical protein
MVAEEVLVNCYNFNPITKAKKGNFQGILKNYPEPGSEPEPKEIFFGSTTLDKTYPEQWPASVKIYMKTYFHLSPVHC